MSYRKILYGYQIQNGELTLVPEEAAVVNRIAGLYLDGLSYQKLADLLNQKNIPFSQEAPAWDKHKVKRLLENPRYTGQKGYPAILDGGTFSLRSRAAFQEKTAKQTPKAERPALKLVSRLHCAACGRGPPSDGRQEPPERHPIPEMCPMRRCHHHAGRSPAG